MPGRYSLALVAIAILSTTRPGAVQDRNTPVFSTESELVALHVTVKDSTGAYVRGLPQDAFSVVEDGRAQRVGFVTDAETPVTVGLLIDNSASMHPHRDLAIASAAAFVAARQRRDEIFALVFNERVDAVLPPTLPFTGDSTVIRAALERSLTTRGRTALYDAISIGLDYVVRGSRERRALVILSDGGDNASRVTRDEAVRKAQASNAVIYTIALLDGGTSDANPKLLSELAHASGGESFRPARPRAIADAFGRIADDLRHAYTVGYAPSNTRRDGAFRHVRVVVTAPPGRRLVVRNRAGYVAGLPGVNDQ